MRVFLHKNQEVVVWSVGSAHNPERMTVSYSYLRDHGRVGKKRQKIVFEDDFYEEFLRTDKKVDLSWNYDLLPAQEEI